MQQYQRRELDEAGVAQRMCLLLAGHEDLLEGFGRFLSRVRWQSMPQGSLCAQAWCSRMQPGLSCRRAGGPC